MRVFVVLKTAWRDLFGNTNDIDNMILIRSAQMECDLFCKSMRESQCTRELFLENSFGLFNAGLSGCELLHLSNDGFLCVRANGCNVIALE